MSSSAPANGAPEGVPAELANSTFIKELGVAVSAARQAGAVIAQAFLRPKNVLEKSAATDLVTETDKHAEELVLGCIREAFPSHLFIGEESTAAQGFADGLTDAPTWMVDPLDGTTNFVHSFPWVCVSIGLAVKKQVVVGVVFNPVLNELFVAARGGGAYLNGTRLAVAEQAELSRALVVTEIGTSRESDTFDAIYDRMRTLTASARGLRCCGSCALNLCSVACGRADAFYEINFGGCWDCAAGSLMVEEAGGAVLDPAGGPFGLMARRVLAANGVLAPKVAAVLAGCKLGAAEAPPPPPVAPA